MSQPFQPRAGHRAFADPARGEAAPSRQVRRPLLQRLRGSEFVRRITGVYLRHTARLDLFLAFAAVLGMTATVLMDLPIRGSAFAGSDIKTLFASITLFLHGQNAYTTANIQSVFAAQGVVFPQSWFAHAPVYPPTTLALLAPLAALSITTSVYLVVAVSALLFAWAVYLLLRHAAALSLPLVARILVAVVCVCCPVFAFALTMGNASVAVSSLCIIVFLGRRQRATWTFAIMLAMAVLLKPHVAIWMLTGMLLIRERASRDIAVRATAIAASFTVAVIAALAATHQLALQVRGYATILGAETAAGSSMNTSSHEVLPIYAQITSLHSLLGFWWQSSHAQTALASALLVALGLLAARSLHAASSTAGRDLNPALGAWLAFGMLATYHRTHDALILLIMLPWLFQTIRTSPRAWYGWAMLLLFVALNTSWSFDAILRGMNNGQFHGLMAFLLLRQAALADLGLLLVLFAVIVRQRRPERVHLTASNPPSYLLAAK